MTPCAPSTRSTGRGCLAAVAAARLGDCLAEGHHDLTSRYLAAVHGILDHAWSMATGADARYLPSVRERQSRLARLLGSYQQRLVAAAADDPDPDLYQPIFEFIDFARLDGEVAVGESSFGIFARDMRVTSMRDWRTLLRDRRAGVDKATSPRTAPVQRMLVLAHDDFTEAVRDALRGVARSAGLEGNPLLRSRVVVERAGDDPAEEALAALLREVAGELADHPRDARLHRALVAAYLSPAPTQEAAAERLDLPFSTFRRHLSQGVEHVVERLWHQELHGPGRESGPA